MSLGDAHAWCMSCLGLEHAQEAVEEPNSCLYCAAFGDHLLVARLEGMQARAPCPVPERGRITPYGVCAPGEKLPLCLLGCPPPLRWYMAEELTHLECRMKIIQKEINEKGEDGEDPSFSDSISIHTEDDLELDQCQRQHSGKKHHHQHRHQDPVAKEGEPIGLIVGLSYFSQAQKTNWERLAGGVSLGS
ncbi:hypothetical protein SKAU_G00192560 [Synaphobranchus kaupii]|uniref:Uncharacterized protein n=1 Tax=Synaphobranchus kaupii TaxID=118154 RepID=A0A9Q1FDZ7_SYNKA|nr:hypothetical protein SKAU_G00192560 [Synaphobranchus kaupii]